MINNNQLNGAMLNSTINRSSVITTNTLNKGFKDMILFKLNESTNSRRRVPFDLIQTADRMTGITGQTVALSSIKVYINGGSEATATGTVTEIGGGLYYYELAASEVSTLGQITVRINVSAAVPFKAIGQIVAFDPYDAIRYGLTSLPNAVVNASGGIITFGTGAGQLYVDGTGGSYLSLTQPVTASDLSSKNTQNVGDCLSAARAEGAGKWVLSGTTLTLYGPDGSQVVRTFTLNDPQNPTQRT